MVKNGQYFTIGQKMVTCSSARSSEYLERAYSLPSVPMIRIWTRQLAQSLSFSREERSAYRPRVPIFFTKMLQNTPSGQGGDCPATAFSPRLERLGYPCLPCTMQGSGPARPSAAFRHAGAKPRPARGGMGGVLPSCPN
jgi:hypothetical protein